MAVGITAILFAFQGGKTEKGQEVNFLPFREPSQKSDQSFQNGPEFRHMDSHSCKGGWGMSFFSARCIARFCYEG